MAKNPVPCQKGLRLPAFVAASGSKAQCAETLFAWRWPPGLVCPECGHSNGDIEAKTRGRLPCQHGRNESSVTAGPIFPQSQRPLTTLVSRAVPAHRAEERQLGVSYLTAWRIEHKRVPVMLERDADSRLTGVIVLDDTYWGGECHGQTPGRGSPDKTPFLAALGQTLDGQSLALRLCVVAGFRKRELAAWTETFIHPDSLVVSDRLGGFNGIAAAGIEHQGMVAGGAASVEMEEFRGLNTVLGKVKNPRHGTYDKVSPQPAPRYLAELCYRFDRRFDLAAILPRLGSAADALPAAQVG